MQLCKRKTRKQATAEPTTPRGPVARLHTRRPIVVLASEADSEIDNNHIILLLTMPKHVLFQDACYLSVFCINTV